MIRFLHITDLHITAPETDDPGRQTDTVAALARLIEIANKLEPKPAFVVASGDLTNIGDVASYTLLASMLDKLEMPVVLGLGNHDSRADFYRAIPSFGDSHPNQPFDHDQTLEGIHVISIDSSVPGKVSGAFEDGQIENLKETLAAHPDMPKLLVIHHPPQVDPERTKSWASLSREATDQLAETIADYGVVAILSGHIHINRVTVWHGVPVVTTMGQQSTVDLSRNSGLAIIEGTGFAICDVIEGNLQVTFVPLETSAIIKEIPENQLQSFS